MVRHTKKGKGKQAYVKKQQHKKAELKKETKKDMVQDYDLKGLKKKVDDLTKSTKGWLLTDSVGYKPILTAVGLSSSTAGALVQENFFLPNIGVSQSSMQGTTCVIKRIRFRYSVKMSIASDVDVMLKPQMNIRVMIICFHRPNAKPELATSAQAMTPNAFLQIGQQNSAVTMTTSSSIHAHLNIQERDNYHVYYDHVHSLSPITADGTAPLGQDKSFSGVIDKLIIPTKKNSVFVISNAVSGAGLSVPDVERNLWGLYVFSDNISADTDPPSIAYNFLTEFDQ